MKESVRWMITFYHPDGSWQDEPDFPDVKSWQPNKYIARQEAARVLAELRETRGDKRDWFAVGLTDPLAILRGQILGGQPWNEWTMHYDDLVPNSGGEIKSVAGAWEGIVDGEEMKRILDEARHPDRARYPIE